MSITPNGRLCSAINSKRRKPAFSFRREKAGFLVGEETYEDYRFNGKYCSCSGCAFEHGLSLYLEGKGHRILFDTGQSENFAVNAKRLGVDLAAVDLAILSHGHYDHGGGLKRFLELNQKAPVYLSVYAFEPHFNGVKDIGIDPKLRRAEGSGL